MSTTRATTTGMETNRYSNCPLQLPSASMATGLGVSCGKMNDLSIPHRWLHVLLGTGVMKQATGLHVLGLSVISPTKQVSIVIRLKYKGWKVRSGISGTQRLGGMAALFCACTVATTISHSNCLPSPLQSIRLRTPSQFHARLCVMQATPITACVGDSGGRRLALGARQQR